MSRFFLSAAALFSLLFATLAIPARIEARSRRCGEEPPETLLSLYKSSTEIHIGTFDRIEEVGMIEDTEDYSVVDTRKHFSISSTLKGESRKFYAAAEQDYRYKSVEPETTEESGVAVEEETAAETEDSVEPDAEDSYLADMPKPGDSVMIFLQRDEEAGTVILSHYRDAVKKMDAEKMAAYETRVSELNSIFSAKKVDDAEIVAWLVKTAVDPLTRWDGAFELLSGFQNSEWREERVKYLKEKEERGEAIEEWEKLESDSDEDDSVRSRIAYAKLLSETQKEELLSAIVNDVKTGSEDGDEGPAELDEGDRMLLELVSRWGDNRLARHLLDQLRNKPDLPYLNSQMMQMVVKVIGDPKLEDLAAKYTNLYGSDEEVVSEEDLKAAGYGEEPARSSDQTDSVETAETQGTEVESDTEEVPVQRLTYAEIRTDLLNKFIALGDKLTTTEAK